MQGRDFRISSLAKGDIDTVVEIHQREALSHLRVLMEKLYKRNPQEWKKGGQASLDASVARIFDYGTWQFDELGCKTGADCIHLSFREDFQGDRVLAFVAGLGSMVMASYDDKKEFFILDDLDPQGLYNSARNVEIAVWQLSNKRTSKGNLFLLSNEATGEVHNLSFEREFGKLIADQDTLAQIIADKTNRSISRIIQTMATAVFLPI